MKPNQNLKIKYQKNSSPKKSQLAEENHPNKLLYKKLPHQDHMISWMLRICQRTGIGGILMEQIMYRGQEISISLFIVVLVGLMDLLVRLRIELILLGIELGLIWIYLLRLLLIVKLEDPVMEAIQAKCIYMPITMVFLKKPVNPIWPKILQPSAAQISKSARTALPQQALIQATKEIAGPKKSTPFGKYLSMVQYQVPIKWKHKFI